MFHVTCVACGIDGILLHDESSDVPRCLQCGQPFQVVAQAKGQSPRRREPTDDVITTWLSEGPFRPPPAKSYEFACRHCGYLGPKPHKDRLGMVSCPACGEVDRAHRKYGRSRTVCPDCGLVFELLAHDRGRTVLCPGCNYFLGCLLPIERQRHRPFWWRR